MSKRSALSAILLAVVLITACVVLSACEGKGGAEQETAQPPYFVGLKDITVEQGDGIAYRAGVAAYDHENNAIDFQVDSSQVRVDTVGTYTAVYIATDKNGSTTRAQITVTVITKPKVRPEVLYALIDEEIEKRGMNEMSRAELCSFLYSYIKSNTSYVGDSDKSDWIAEAYRAITERKGDCFTYYAVARAFFERCGVEVITVERSKGVLPSTHYWLLVNMGTKESPMWYHWDCCPHYKEYPFYSCLVTDAELLAYNQKVENYYTFDLESYPRTPTTPYS